MFVLKMYVKIMSLSVLLCNVCVCYVYILKMSKKIKVKKKFRIWILNAIFRGLFFCLRSMMIVHSVDIGGIVNHHCLSYLLYLILETIFV
jgi:hypothetical protein